MQFLILLLDWVVEPLVKDAKTIETGTQTTNSEFSKLKQEFDKVNKAAIEQNSPTDAINLIDDIWIEDSLFDTYDTEAIKNISKEMIDIVEPIETITVTDDNAKFNPIETITIEDNIDILLDADIAIDALKKVKIITTNSNQLRLASNRIKKKYLCQKLREILKNGNKKTAD